MHACNNWSCVLILLLHIHKKSGHQHVQIVAGSKQTKRRNLAAMMQEHRTTKPLKSPERSHEPFVWPRSHCMRFQEWVQCTRPPGRVRRRRRCWGGRRWSGSGMWLSGRPLGGTPSACHKAAGQPKAIVDGRRKCLSAPPRARGGHLRRTLSQTSMSGFGRCSTLRR